MSKNVYYLSSDASFIWVESTNCETGFVNTTARPDSLANLTRNAVMMHGDHLPIAPARPGHGGAMPNDVDAMPNDVSAPSDQVDK